MAEKAPTALRTIGEVVAETGIPAHVLRYWEQQIAALRPVRRSGGRRYYRADDIATIRRLHHMIHAEGFTLEGAARALSARPAAHQPAGAIAAAMPAGPTGSAIDRARLVALRDRLQRALAQS